MWRNPLKPSEILAQLCEQYGFDTPVYTPDTVCIGKKIKFEAEANEKFEENENGGWLWWWNRDGGGGGMMVWWLWWNDGGGRIVIVEWWWNSGMVLW